MGSVLPPASHVIEPPGDGRDGSADSLAALDLLKQFHRREEDRVHVLSVVETLVLFTGRIDDPADGGRQKLMAVRR